MQEKTYTYRKDVFTLQTRRYARSFKGYGMWSRIAALFLLLGVINLLIPAIKYRTWMQHYGGLLCGMLIVASLFCAALPCYLSYRFWGMAKRKYGSPYSRMENPFIITNEKGVSFGYRDQYNPDGNGVLFEISYEDIKRVEYNRNSRLITFIGKGRVLLGKTGEEIKPDAASVDIATFAFFDCFENAGEFQKNLMGHGVEITASNGV